MVIRIATITDLSIIQHLAYELYKDLQRYDTLIDAKFIKNSDYVKNLMNTPNHIYWIAEEDNQVAGYAMAKINEAQPCRPYKRTELDELFIVENFRGQGLGAQFVKIFLAWSKEVRVKSAIIEALAKNTSAIALYEKMGFTPLNVRLEQKI